MRDLPRRNFATSPPVHHPFMSQTCSSLSAFNSILAGKRPVVAKFGATWCGPCRNSAAPFEHLAQKHGTKVTFVNIDVDQAKDVSSHYRVKSLPTFIYYHNGQEVKRATGASTMDNDVSAFVDKYGKTVFEMGQGQRLDSTPAPSKPESTAGSSSSSSSSSRPNPWRDKNFNPSQRFRAQQEQTSTSTSTEDDFDVVCENGVCRQVPKQSLAKTAQKTDDEDKKQESICKSCSIM